MVGNSTMRHLRRPPPGKHPKCGTRGGTGPDLPGLGGAAGMLDCWGDADQIVTHRSRASGNPCKSTSYMEPRLREGDVFRFHQHFLSARCPSGGWYRVRPVPLPGGAVADEILHVARSARAAWPAARLRGSLRCAVRCVPAPAAAFAPASREAGFRFWPARALRAVGLPEPVAPPAALRGWNEAVPRAGQAARCAGYATPQAL